MFSAFFKAVGQLGDPAIRRVLWIGIGAAGLVFLLLWTAVATLLTSTALFETLWLDRLVDALGGLATVVLTWLLFPGVISAVMGFLSERVADAVDSRHYPGLSPAPGASVWTSAISALRVLAVTVVLNLVLLVFLFVAPVFPFVFYGVNGYLLGREYFEQVALRRIGQDEARALRKRHRLSLFLGGAFTAFLLTVPVVNLLAPVLVTAAMVHRFEAWRSEIGGT